MDKTKETQSADLIADAERQHWLAANAAAIDAYNKRVAAGTILSDFTQPFQ